MKLIAPYLSDNSFEWLYRVVFLFVLIAFSSCSTHKETSYAYLDDIYKPYDLNALQFGYNVDENGEVADQDASVIKPYEPTVRDYWPYVKPLNFQVAFNYSNYIGYSYYNRWPFNWGYDNYCYRNGWPRGYCDYRRYHSSFGLVYPYNGNDYYGYGYGYGNYNPYYYGGVGGGYVGGTDGSYLFKDNVSFFKGVNSTSKRSGYAINYAKYSNYRAVGAGGSENGRKSGTKGKNRFQSNYSSPNKARTNKSTNFNTGSNYQRGSSGGSSSPSPSRSSGSGGGSYSGKRPR